MALEDKLRAVVPFREYYIAKLIFKYGTCLKDLNVDHLKILELGYEDKYTASLKKDLGIEEEEITFYEAH